MSIYYLLGQESYYWPFQNHPSFQQPPKPVAENVSMCWTTEEREGLQLEEHIHFVILHFSQQPCCLVLFHSYRSVSPSCVLGISPSIVATPVKAWAVSVPWSWSPPHAAILAPHVSWGNIYLDLKSQSVHTKVVTEEAGHFFWHSYGQIFFCKAISLLDWHDSE